MKIAGVFKIALLAALLLIQPSDSLATIHRSRAAVRQFIRLHPCPSTHKKYAPCPGWIVDHVIPLACGGADKPTNMQWQSVAAAKAKDKIERKNCKQYLERESR